MQLFPFKCVSKHTLPIPDSEFFPIMNSSFVWGSIKRVCTT